MARKTINVSELEFFVFQVQNGYEVSPNFLDSKFCIEDIF